MTRKMFRPHTVIGKWNKYINAVKLLDRDTP